MVRLMGILAVLVLPLIFVGCESTTMTAAQPQNGKELGNSGIHTSGSLDAGATTIVR